MLELRPATAADYAYAKQVKHAAYKDMVLAQFGTWDPSVQDGFFDKSWNDGNYNIILMDGEPCGFCRIDEHDRVLQLVEFAVEVSKQNRGIGSMVLSRFLEMARAKGKLAQMNVMRTNTRAKALYERLGFAVFAENEVQYGLRYTEAAVAEQASARLKAVMAMGSNPKADQIDTLVSSCAIEPDFYVRDMLTWALTRHPPELVVPKLLAELHSKIAQARSQALHSLSKIKDASTWPAITSALLRDPDDEVAKSAWRAAVILVPEDQKRALAEELASQLGRGDRQVQLSLSRSLLTLGAEALAPVLQKALSGDDPALRAHAGATERLLR
ncbi:MAG TPA: GNAT family N-acetyltransferase, partial [Steroidobacteraceae bacterium]|nr:GNAT family N-acetyltransferase [Steroidobacteraceae bacterium]